MAVAEREGGDITAAHMLPRTTEPSEIQEFFRHSGTVLVTGATGFLGRLLIEKLLRCCSNVKKIYAVMRSKNGRHWQDRFRTYFDGPLYERLKRERPPEILQKVVAIQGDCSLPDLGMCKEDRERLVLEVNCVFHFAAGGHDEDLRDAALVNLRSTMDLIKVARKMRDLRSFVYVSNALLFSENVANVEEKFIDPPISPQKLLTLVDIVSAHKLISITSTIIEGWPSVSTFTKFLAENVLKTECQDLPVVLIRASMVSGTSREPVAGWISSFHGHAGLFTGVTLGLIRTLRCELNLKADLIPADFVINAAVTASWDVATSKKLHENSEKIKENWSDVTIYNCVSGCDNPITWKKCLNLNKHHSENIASTLEVWHYFFVPSRRPQIYAILNFLLHIFPAYLLDLLACLTGRSSRVLDSYRQLGANLEMLAKFCTRQWTVSNSNARGLLEKQNEEDKKCFDFDVRALDWDLYFHTFARGSRVYLLGDPLETVPKGEQKRFQLKIAHYILVTVVVLGLTKLLLLLGWLFLIK